MDREAWLAQNRTAIESRLRWLRAKPDGTLLVEPAGTEFAIVTKAGSYVRLLLVEQARPRSRVIQSHLNLDDPLKLVSLYTQAAMLGLLWQGEPSKVYAAGLGGARVPLLLHHYLPEVVIECAELYPVMVSVAERYFGLPRGDRMRVRLLDAREWLEGQERPSGYDIIFLDAYPGAGYTPRHLATQEFYRLCQEHMSGEGVLVANLMESDPIYPDRIRTLQSAFEQVYLCPVPGDNCVVFATQGRPVEKDELVRRAVALQGLHRFSFPFVERARDIVAGSAVGHHAPGLEQAQALLDGG